MIRALKIVSTLLLIWQTTAAQDSRIFMFLNKRTDLPELPKEEVDKLMSGHMANIQKMAKEGKLLAAGPFEGGGGIFIFNAKTNEEVTEWLKDDPGVQANRWRLEMYSYQQRSGVVQLVNEPYEMVHYQLIRYMPEIGKAEIADAPDLLKQHDDFIKKFPRDQIVAAGTFGSMEGGVLILKAEADKNFIESDPAVQAGVLRVDYKKLFIAKGAFGER